MVISMLRLMDGVRIELTVPVKAAGLRPAEPPLVHPIRMRLAGIEPATFCSASRRSSTEPQPHEVGPEGIEPSPLA